MCQGDSSSAQPRWELEERADLWRLKVQASSPSEVDISGDRVRLRVRPDAPLAVLPVPARALPIDPDAAKCSFSRKRGELVVEWQRIGVRAEAQDGDRAGQAQAEEASPAAQEEPEPAAPAGASPSEASEARLPAGEATGSAVLAAETTEPAEQPQQAEPAEAEQEPESTVSAEEWRSLGNAAVKAGDMPEAVRCYSAGLTAGGGDVAMLHSNRSMCLHKLGRFEEAVEDSKRCVALRPDFFKGYLRGAMAMRSLGMPEEALAFLKRCPPNDEAAKLVSELKPEADAAEQKRIGSLGGAERAKEEGNVLFRKGLFEAAAAKYSEALGLCKDPESELALALRNNRAACSHQLSDYSSVVRDAGFVLEHDPTNFKALVRRMLALEPLERYEAALADARAVLRQDPRHEVANKMQHRLGKLVRDLGRVRA